MSNHIKPYQTILNHHKPSHSLLPPMISLALNLARWIQERHQLGQEVAPCIICWGILWEYVFYGLTEKGKSEPETSQIFP